MARTMHVGRARSGKPVRRPAPSPTSRWRAWAPATGLFAAFVLGLAVAFLMGAVATGPDATERRIEELKQEEAKRDVAQIATLTELARGSRDRLAPVLPAMADAAPPGGRSGGTVPVADVVRGWRNVVSAEAARYAESPSAGNGVNVARTSMRTAVQQLAVAVEGFESALAAAEPLKGRLIALAGEQRMLALRTWSVAALQLDVINIEAGNGHVHVTLPAGPGSEVVPPDSAPEGGGSR